ncbi:hypothetical protein MNBD_GAMMA12-85 [hydrothermal vent metagenome]|uniref:Lipoprotein n=1 Tax=hydrothermal vent metagenome TaxID=652676 RepID=A0A3B0XTN7_9ZZZZ
MLHKTISIIIFMTVLSGCTLVNKTFYSSISHKAELHLINKEHSKNSVINVTFSSSTGSNPNKAPIYFSLPNGEKMHGVMLLLKTMPKAFGTIYRSLDSKVDIKGKEVTSKNGSLG